MKKQSSIIEHEERCDYTIIHVMPLTFQYRSLTDRIRNVFDLSTFLSKYISYMIEPLRESINVIH